MSKKSNDLSLRFYLVEFECFINSYKKSFVVQCITFFSDGRTGKVLDDKGNLTIVPYADYLQHNVLSSLYDFLPLSTKDLGVCVKLHPIDFKVSADDFKGYRCVRPSAKAIATVLISIFMSRLLNLLSNKSNNNSI